MPSVTTLPGDFDFLDFDEIKLPDMEAESTVNIDVIKAALGKDRDPNDIVRCGVSHDYELPIGMEIKDGIITKAPSVPGTYKFPVYISIEEGEELSEQHFILSITVLGPVTPVDPSASVDPTAPVDPSAPSPETPSNGGSQTPSGAPDTGDNMNLMFWILMSGMSMIIAFSRRRKDARIK